MTNSTMTLPFTPLAKLVPRPNSTRQVPPQLPFFSTHQNTLLHSPTHSTISHLLLQVTYNKRTLQKHMHVNIVTTHHTQMCYMLHVQYTNKCEIEGLIGGERGRRGRREGGSGRTYMGKVGGDQGGMEVPHLPLPLYHPLTPSYLPNISFHSSSS